ncbi:hypothetical protein J2046_005625 [Rhizobium petrolearium]|uniref:Uncharacterized protein n=2 Tax=Neorhizobium TaxID=1525371 RepID=A0ABV0MG28_9HYPH|nr:hypothetical protein [Neorhizobium petrolearium]MBP1847341.1 hypothetical protein [Neorhizobium petrolearium]MCC2614373.1 hypothetical protein [Neorhizobium petrolearium]WGI72473.1 hypothetical protein QEO92_31760 [Neorhizobium petrolearium]
MYSNFDDLAPRILGLGTDGSVRRFLRDSKNRGAPPCFIGPAIFPRCFASLMFMLFGQFQELLFFSLNEFLEFGPLIWIGLVGKSRSKMLDRFKDGVVAHNFRSR